MMSARKVFETAVAAFRAGAVDVIVKSPDQVPYLQQRVALAAGDKRRVSDTSHLLESVIALHESLMETLLHAHRRASELEEQLQGADAAPPDENTLVLVVDEDGWLHSQLGMMVQIKGGYRLESAANGGEALDLAGRQRFHIALVRDSLPDLPGSMVVRTIKDLSPDTIVLLYVAPTEAQAGSVQVCEGSKVIPFLPQFSDPGQILERLDELRDAFRAKARERRYLATFRQQHFDLLKRYAELRQRLRRTAEEQAIAEHSHLSPLGLVR
jgi:DNA-binding NtrC family response regulator